ncbi:MAG: hypothetical protein DDG60_12100 [Anaerolineae bacterium]|nr:MAG: hypothetical protein DDG60_12100 [Anaerolineae bacterium]
MVFLLVTISLPSGSARAFAPHPQEIPPSYQRIAENETFALYVDSATLAFKLLDKRNNYLWHSGIDELQQGDRLNKSWRAFAQSGVSIEYLDEKAVSKRISIANAEHTLEVKPIENGVEAEIKFEEVGISFQVRLRLEAEGVRVEIPSVSIRQENPAFKLGLVYLYPFLGATRGSSTPGYMFLPDGTGSLIRFADSTKAKNMFYGRYYGADLGMIAVMPYDPGINRAYPISFPVFGMVHGEKGNAFLAVVEDGAAYGEIQAHPAGILTNFNFLYNAFIYNESYFQATNRSGAGVTTIQKQTNDFDVTVHYRFLHGGAADYVGMARSYQQYLVEKGILQKVTDPNPNIGIRLEFLGGDKEKALFWWRFVSMTTIRQMQTLLDNLQIANPQVIYFGWQPLGASSMPPLSLKLERSLGTLDDLRTLAEKITADGGRFSLYLDPQAALWKERGYSPRRDLAMAITNVNLEGYNRYYNYYFTLDALQRRFAALTESIASQLQADLALDGIGFTLYSDFRENAPLNRQQAIRAYQDVLGKSPVPLGFYRPNDYLWSLMSAYYDMPLGDNGYIYTSEAVPFLPIVLSGYVPYYGAALNFSPNLEEDILRHVDYGMYPSYFLTYEPTAKMLDTRSTWIYTSSHEQWGEQIRQTYAWMNALLAPVRGQEITARQKLREGVFVTTYANGKQIVVNYTDQPVNYKGVTVQGRDAALVENMP